MNNMNMKLFLCTALLASSNAYAMDVETKAEIEEFNKNRLYSLIKRTCEVAEKKDEAGAPNFVAIAGGSAVGKSYLANQMVQLLKEKRVNAAVLHGDDFIDPDHNDPAQFHPRLNHALMHSVIQQIKGGQPVVSKPAWDLTDMRSPALIVENFSVAEVDVVLFEGEFTMCQDEPYNFKQYSSFGVFVTADNRDIAKWNWDRQRGIQEGETEDQFRSRVVSSLKQYDRYTMEALDKAEFTLIKDAEHRYTMCP